MSHEIVRNTIKWGSFGKYGDEPLTERLIKDLSDEHLQNIIPFIQERVRFYGHLMLSHMMNEVEYRRVHNISVPDYFNFKTFKLGR